MDKNLFELKQWLKSCAVKIKDTKRLHKQYQRDGFETKDYYSKEKRLVSDALHDLNSFKKEYRHHHIAYSELRGRSRSEIENPRENNLPDEQYISQIKKAYARVESETVCASS